MLGMVFFTIPMVGSTREGMIRRHNNLQRIGCASILAHNAVVKVLSCARNHVINEMVQRYTGSGQP